MRELGSGTTRSVTTSRDKFLKATALSNVISSVSANQRCMSVGLAGADNALLVQIRLKQQQD